MTSDQPEDHITRREVVRRLPGMEAISVKADEPYGAGLEAGLSFDVYSPPGEAAKPRPVVVSVAGYPDAGMVRLFGCRYKDFGWSVSWARLIAASGMVAVTYANREPAADLAALLGHLRDHEAALGIDGRRLGLIASSGHGPLALQALMEQGNGHPPPACAVLICPYTLDLEGRTAVADAASTFRFANPNTSRTVDDLSPSTALFVARAGRDEMPGLNGALDRFVAACLARNLPLTLVNLPGAPHAFDIMDDSPASRGVVDQAIAFLRTQLGV